MARDGAKLDEAGASSARCVPKLELGNEGRGIGNEDRIVAVFDRSSAGGTVGLRGWQAGGLLVEAERRCMASRRWDS